MAHLLRVQSSAYVEIFRSKSSENKVKQTMQQKGFSLIELLVVITVIGIIVVIAVPNLLASRRAANEGSALASLRAITVAQKTYESTTGAGQYGTLAELKGTGSLDVILGSGSKSGYIFSVTPIAVSSTNPPLFDATANAGRFGSSISATGTRNFYTNESGVLYENTAGQNNPPKATSTSNRIVINGNAVD